MQSLIVVLDQGTTGSTCVLFEAETLNALSVAKTEFPQIFPQPGWVEHNPEDIWKSTLASFESAWKIASEKSPLQKSQIAAIGITNQRETVLPWNKKTGEVLHNAIVWQDRRTASFCEKLSADPQTKKMVLEKTGLVLDPYFSGSKMHWMMQQHPHIAQSAKNQECVFGTIDSFLMYRLSGKKSLVTDPTNASRTLLFNLKTRTYDKDLLSLFNIPEGVLPHIQSSSSMFGVTSGVPGIPDNIPILGCLGDQQAALLGQDCTQPGEAKITYGTGAFLLMNVGEKPIVTDQGILGTVADDDGNKVTYALEGSAFIAGAAVQFIRDQFNWFKESPESLELALRDERDPYVSFVPAFAGLGAPYWNPHAKAAFMGLSRGTSKSQMMRAVLEGIAFQNVQILDIMQKVSQRKICGLSVDGKAAGNNFLMQFQTNLLQVPIARPHVLEATARGAALAARRSLKVTTPLSKLSGDVFKVTETRTTTAPMIERWMRAVSCVNAYH